MPSKKGGSKAPVIVTLNKNKFAQNAMKNKGTGEVEFSPLSGYEPKYEPNRWNQNSKIKHTNNCYSYMKGIPANVKDKAQPGYFSGFDHIGDHEYNCPSFYKRLKKDIPSMYLVKFGTKCKKGFHKAYMAIDPTPHDQDYHFYRQDSNGYWSHKPGRSDAVNVDASGKRITNPELADRNYPSLKYTESCFFFCLNKHLAKGRSRT